MTRLPCDGINFNPRSRSASIKPFIIVIIVFCLLPPCLLFFLDLSSMADHGAPSFEKPRLVVKKVLAKSQEDGDGAKVRRSIGRSAIDPFPHPPTCLLLRFMCCFVFLKFGGSPGRN